MAKETVRIYDAERLTPRSRVFEAGVGQGVTAVAITIQRASLTDEDLTLNLTFSYSMDGKDWKQRSAFTLYGVIPESHRGLDADSRSTCVCSLPHPESATRTVRIEVDNNKAADFTIDFVKV